MRVLELVRVTAEPGGDTSRMSYALGSQTESMAFADSGIEYGPEGLRHAVDRQSLTSGVSR